MKYVSEFRNAELARAVAAEIAVLADTGRHYKLMEVCGGHTHTIYRHGIKDLLPPQIELVAPVTIGEVLVTHGGVAIGRVETRVMGS